MNSSGFAVAPAAFLALSLAAGSRPASGQADFTRYVALGDSLTAAFAAGGLSQEAQLGSYARLLSRQARGAAAAFEQPLITAPGIPAVIERGDRERRTLVPLPGLGSPTNLTLPRPYDNLAVPGAGAGDVLGRLADGGGLHDLVLRGIGTQLQQALLLEPTFVTVWVGGSDALGAAVSGIVLDGVTLTPADSFAADLDAIVRKLAAEVGAGALATIPLATDLPFVNTLAPVAVDRSTGLPLEADGRPVALTGSNGPLNAGDFILLTASPLLARGDGAPPALGGSGLPLPDNVVLSRIEAVIINRRIEEYNRAIRRAAAEAGFALVDMAEVFGEWRRSGVIVGSERFTSDYPSGGLFSLDGVHPSALGHALLANAFVEAINDAYGSRIPLLSVVAPAREERDYRDGGRWPPFVFTSRAYRNLRFGLGLPGPRRLVRLKAKVLRRSRENGRQRLRQQGLPAEPRMARLAPANAASRSRPFPAL